MGGGGWVWGVGGCGLKGVNPFSVENVHLLVFFNSPFVFSHALKIIRQLSSINVV